MRSYGHVRCNTTRIIFKRIFTSVVKYCTRNIAVRKHMSLEPCMINLRVRSTVKLPTSSLCRSYLFLVSRFCFGQDSKPLEGIASHTHVCFFVLMVYENNKNLSIYHYAPCVGVCFGNTHSRVHLFFS